MPEDTLEIVHKWAVRTLKQNNWSARQWALQAGIAPSTLQRFITEKPWVLSATVITKLSTVSGTFPELNAVDDSLKIKPVILRIMGNKKGNLVTTGSNFNAFGEFSSNSFAIPVSWDTMDQAGYRKGDIIVVDPEAEYKSGDELLIKTTKSIAVYELQEHFLIARSTKRYDTLDIGLVDVLGRVMQVVSNK